jgi:hypothetical protein
MPAGHWAGRELFRPGCEHGVPQPMHFGLTSPR